MRMPSRPVGAVIHPPVHGILIGTAVSMAIKLVPLHTFGKWNRTFREADDPTMIAVYLKAVLRGYGLAASQSNHGQKRYASNRHIRVKNTQDTTPQYSH